ncbi:helix-turn-helix transcriptional regulator [Candidatus Riflebacteria bacterium]
MKIGTPGTRLIRLYLLFLSGRKVWSLKQLAAELRVARQTVLRWIEQLQLIPNKEFKLKMSKEGKENYYQVILKEKKQNYVISIEALDRLIFFKDLVSHFLPAPLKKEIEAIGGDRGIEVDKDTLETQSFFYARWMGKIDYSGFGEVFSKLQNAMREKKICQITYRRRADRIPQIRDYILAPIKFVTYRNAIYIRCNITDENGKIIEKKPWSFAIQRIKKIKILKKNFIAPAYKDSDHSFGFDMVKPFKVKLEFSPAMSNQIRERKWSSYQKFRQNKKSGWMTMTFSSTSFNELKAWVLCFGPEVRVISPKKLKEEIKEDLKQMQELYV